MKTTHVLKMKCGITCTMQFDEETADMDLDCSRKPSKELLSAFLEEYDPWLNNIVSQWSQRTGKSMMLVSAHRKGVTMIDGAKITTEQMNNAPPAADENDSRKKFGPFLIPADYQFPIAKAGWFCRDCNKPVEKLIVQMPQGILRQHLYQCGCVCVGVWADEQQPVGARHWQMNVRLAQKNGAELLLFNGNKPLAPSFQGFS